MGWERSKPPPAPQNKRSSWLPSRVGPPHPPHQRGRCLRRLLGGGGASSTGTAGSHGSSCGSSTAPCPKRQLGGGRERGGLSYFPAHWLFLTSPALQRPVKIFGSWQGCSGCVNELQLHARCKNSPSPRAPPPPHCQPALCSGEMKARPRGSVPPPNRPPPGCHPALPTLTRSFLLRSPNPFPTSQPSRSRRGKQPIPAWERRTGTDPVPGGCSASCSPPLAPHRPPSRGAPSSPSALPSSCCCPMKRMASRKHQAEYK